MNTIHTIDSLISFENKVCELFKNKEIRAPVHLYYGNEYTMIEIFKKINEEDWVLCSWRSHYQCLLKGVPEDILLQDIKLGKSISLNYPNYKIVSSAIVAGNIPIATGLALASKLKKSKEHIYCFIGDMTSQTGTFHENYHYSINHDLPITWIIEDNNKSVCTDTKRVWNCESLVYEKDNFKKIIYYKYDTKYPHAGTGERIQF
jgi:pyruvate dehydrogenase E1 component alpha subunit